MFKWLRPPASPYQAALAMVGAKAGAALLVAGASEPTLAAELARVTGLNGSTRVRDPGDHGEAVLGAAAAAGALVEFEQAPLVPETADAYDIVVVPQIGQIPDGDRAAVLGGLLRALRPGGRVIVTDGAIRATTFPRLRHTPPEVAPDALITLLARVGALAPRLLGRVDGVSYFEARAPRPAPVDPPH